MRLTIPLFGNTQETMVLLSSRRIPIFISGVLSLDFLQKSFGYDWVTARLTMLKESYEGTMRLSRVFIWTIRARFSVCHKETLHWLYC